MHLLQCTDQYRRFIHFSIVLDVFHLYVYEQFSCVYLCAPCASLMPVEFRRELWIPRTVLWMVMSHDVSAKSRTSLPNILLLRDFPPKCHLAFCHCVSFSSSELQQLLGLPLLWNMTVLKSQVLCRISFNLDFSNVCLIIWLKMLTGERKIAEREPLSRQWSKAPEISTAHGCCYQLCCPDAGWCLPGFFFLL